MHALATLRRRLTVCSSASVGRRVIKGSEEEGRAEARRVILSHVSQLAVACGLAGRKLPAVCRSIRELVV